MESYKVRYLLLGFSMYSNAFEVHPCFGMHQYFIPFYCQIIFCCINILCAVLCWVVQSCPTLTPIRDYWKTIALTRWILVDKAMSLLFNMLCRLIIGFPPRSKHLLISWLQSPSAVILEPPPKIKVLTVSIVSPTYLPWSDGTRCHDLSFLNVEL